MSSALRRGRTLDPAAVKAAKHQREERIQTLGARSPISLTRKERHELSRIGGRKHPAKQVIT